MTHNNGTSKAFAVRSCPELVCEFYANMYEVRKGSFKTFFKGVDIEIDVGIIDTFGQVPRIDESCILMRLAMCPQHKICAYISLRGSLVVGRVLPIPSRTLY